jgi:hypothetical protein
MIKHVTVENIPLLYIVQPKLSPAITNMQQSILINHKRTKNSQLEKNHVTQDAQPEKGESSANQVVQLETGKDMKKKKKFKQFQDMTIEEQVIFLVNLPSKLQSIQCVITSKNTKYYGSILDYRDGVVSISHSNHPTLLPLKIEEIEKITIVDVKG